MERLRAKPGGEVIPVVIGDMAQVPASGPFSLVYLVFNTLFGLLSQARQAGCFRNVARVLDPGGAFVIECFVPDLTRFDRGQRVQARAVTEDSAILEVSRQTPRTSASPPRSSLSTDTARTCGPWRCATPGPANWT